MYKTSQLIFATMPVIVEKVSNLGGHCGEFFVVAEAFPHDNSGMSGRMYLHRDGLWNDLTDRNDLPGEAGSVWTGYFPTKEEAEKVLAQERPHIGV